MNSSFDGCGGSCCIAVADVCRLDLCHGNLNMHLQSTIMQPPTGSCFFMFLKLPF